MTAEQPSGRRVLRSATNSVFPKRSFLLLLAVSLAVGAAIYILRSQFDAIHERWSLRPAFPGIAMMVTTAVGILVWAAWLLFFAKRRVFAMLLVALPLGFIVLYHPHFNGDAGIVGWKPRFWNSGVVSGTLAEVSDSTALVADLSRPSPFDFPQFLGQTRNAIVPGISLESDWDQSPPRRLWKQPVGEGWSGFAAVNGFAVTQEQRDDVECVTCYEIETGKLIWKYEAKRRHEDLLRLGKVGPRATPTIDDGYVYTMGGTGALDCLEGATGVPVWSVDVPARVGIDLSAVSNTAGQTYLREDSTLDWGRSGSPLIFNDWVIVSAGAPKNANATKAATLIAFDKKTGKEVWRGGQRAIAYGSPSLATVLGRPQILLVAEDHAVGHDAWTGQELWSYERAGASNGAANCSQVTVLTGNHLLLSKGYGTGGEIIELTEGNEGIQVKSLKTDHRVLRTKLTNPVILNNHAYCLSDGYLECTELFSDDSASDATLKRKWKQRGRFGNGQVLLAGDRLLIHSEDGALLLVAADPAKYQLLGSVETISGICWNTLCLFGDRLLVRSQEEMACFQLPTTESVSEDQEVSNFDD